MKSSRLTHTLLAIGILCHVCAGPLLAKFKLQTQAFLRFNQVFASGSASDYSIGNQFPQVSAHNTLGVGVAFFHGDRLKIGCETHFLLIGTKYTMTDPKEKDTIRLTPRLQLQEFLMSGYRLWKSRKATLDTQIGLGIVWLPGRGERLVVSKYENEVVVTYPGKIAIGWFIGCEYSKPIGNNAMRISVSPRYFWTGLDPAQSMVSILVGLRL